MQYAYVRVSSTDQNIGRQLAEMKEFGIAAKNIYIDKMSGCDFNRPAYQKLIRRLRPHDLVVVKSIDRLGRNYAMIIEEWSRITKQLRADIKVLDMPLLDTRERSDNLIGRFISDIVLQILSFVSENERVNIKTRQREGILLAKQRGVRFGRPCVPRPGNFDEVAERYDGQVIGFSEALAESGLKHTTFYKFLSDVRKKKSPGFRRTPGKKRSDGTFC